VDARTKPPTRSSGRTFAMSFRPSSAYACGRRILRKIFRRLVSDTLPTDVAPLFVVGRAAHSVRDDSSNTGW